MSPWGFRVMNQFESPKSSVHGSNNSTESTDAVFVEMPGRVASHLKTVHSLIKSCKQRAKKNEKLKSRKKIAESHSVKSYENELETLRETVANVQEYAVSSNREKRTEIIRAMVVLYDNMMKTFKQDSEELNKNRKSEYEALDDTVIPLCNGRAKYLKSELEKLAPTIPATDAPAQPGQPVPAKIERSVNASLKQRAHSLFERRGSTLAEQNAKVLPKRSVSAPHELRAYALDEQSGSGPPEHQWHRGTPIWT